MRESALSRYLPTTLTLSLPNPVTPIYLTRSLAGSQVDSIINNQVVDIWLRHLREIQIIGIVESNVYIYIYIYMCHVVCHTMATF